uniref:Uncharacterized protein n=1 Tax=Taenioma perpusillum TaxID=210852 RepID=A0A1Z1MR27_9FLOR|nr:hypothetical protein [Taenioma perpusillum]ARW68538.1 hypothetical protein [Taenioma perpusillum]
MHYFYIKENNISILFIFIENIINIYIYCISILYYLKINK